MNPIPVIAAAAVVVVVPPVRRRAIAVAGTSAITAITTGSAVVGSVAAVASTATEGLVGIGRAAMSGNLPWTADEEASGAA